jgi:hypothetical protein
MSTFMPAKSFVGFPDGNHKNPMRFVEGVESVQVPEAFARLMHEKGLATLAPRKPTHIDPPTAATSKKFAAATKTRRSGKSSRQSSSSQD